MAKWHDDGHTKISDYKLFVQEKNGGYIAYTEPPFYTESIEGTSSLTYARKEAVEGLKQAANNQVGKLNNIIWQCRQALGEV